MQSWLTITNQEAGSDGTPHIPSQGGISEGFPINANLYEKFY